MGLHCEQVNGKDVSLAKEPFDPDLRRQSRCLSSPTTIMSESHFDEYEHYNYDQDKAMFSGHSGKQRSKKEAEQNTNRHNPGGHERKIVQKLQNAEAKQKAANGAANGTTADK